MIILVFYIMWKWIDDFHFTQTPWFKAALLNAIVLFVLGVIQCECRLCGYFTPPYYLFSPVVIYLFFRWNWRRNYFQLNKLSLTIIFLMSFITALLVPYLTELIIEISNAITYSLLEIKVYGVYEPDFSYFTLFSSFVSSILCWHAGVTLFILNICIGLIFRENQRTERG